MDIISVLNYLGITHDRILPFLILVIVMFFISYRFTEPIKKSIASITRAILEIQTIFHSNGMSLIHNLTEAPGSPLQPTQYGKKLIIDSGLEKILNDNKDFLSTELSKKISTRDMEYDVQEGARSLLIDLKENEIMNPVKRYAYDNGANLDIILRTGGLWLRDDFLGEPRKVVSEK